MKIIINKPELTPNFYIARVGSCAGKPLKEPYTANNSFAVYSEQPERDYALILALYTGKAFHPFYVGSCQPALRVRDVRNVVTTNYDQDFDQLMKLKQLTDFADKQEKQLAKTRQLVEQYARSIIRQFTSNSALSDEIIITLTNTNGTRI